MENKNERVNYQSPIYLQLREVVRNKIEDGEYPPGTAIPSENDLARTYGINRLTVRNAVDALVNEGLLRRVQGKGVYVLYVMDQKMERDLEVLGGFTQMTKGGRRRLSTKVMTKVRRHAGGKYGMLFGIDPQDTLFYVKQLCYADDEPVSLQEIFLPEQIVPKLEEIDLAVFSLYEVYDFYGIKLKYANQTLDLTRLEPKDARLLDTQANRDVFLMEYTSFDENDRPIEFVRTYARADKCNFTVKYRK